jgi:lysophospholipase L1-like esterase
MRLAALLLIAGVGTTGEPALRIADQIVFSDQGAVVTVPAAGLWRWTHRVLTRAGWQSLPDGESPASSSVVVPAGTAGIHVLAFSAPVAGELRFIAIAPPPALSAEALGRTLPRRGATLLTGEPFTLLAMGDSVTNTGWYDRILARLLERATGNHRITVVNRSYPGRSVDASVRAFAADTAVRPDLACIMYGLNDQGAWASRDGYVEQYRWLVERLRATCGADVVLLQPTPDLAPLQPGSRDQPGAALRTIGFAEALRPIAAELGVPLAGTFTALWQARGTDLPSALTSMLTCYPLGFSRQLTSVVEGDGSGDTIHPNALGHTAIAEAVFAALAGVGPVDPLAVTATSRWQDTGLISVLHLRNAGSQQLAGRLEVHAQNGALVTPRGPLTYELAPGAATSLTLSWPEVRGVDDLFRHPYDRYVAQAAPLVAVLDFRDGDCRARAVEAPINPAGGFLRGRQVCSAPVAHVRLLTPQGERTVEGSWPADSAVGRQRLVAELADGPVRAPVAAELAWVRMAAASSGEAVIDGDIGEWRDDSWAPLGEPCQARWLTGTVDHRADGEFNLRWASRSGRDGVHVALRIAGDPGRDSFTIFLDTRPAAELGGPGPYWWISGSCKAGGQVSLQGGETSPPGAVPPGRWRQDSSVVTAEFTIPYGVFGSTAWPVGGDLGLSFWWTHQGPGGTTQLQWSEDGHPWNTRWYGVVRRDPSGPLPWVVRVR